MFNEFYKLHRVIHEIIAPYSPKINGKFERNSRTLTKLVVLIMLYYGAASYWWRKILFIILHVFNQVQTSKTNVSPYEIMKKIQPHLPYSDENISMF